MALIGYLIVGAAAVAGLLVGGVYGLLALTCLGDARGGSRSVGLVLLALCLLQIGLPAYGVWRAFNGSSGLIPALIGLALAAGLGWAAGGVAHGVANP